MTPRASAPRPITRRPESRPPAPPTGRVRVLAALLPWKHQLRPRSADILATLEWTDLYAMDGRRLAAEVAARLARPECRRHLVGVFSPSDRVGDPAGDRHAAEGLQPLWRPPVGAPADEGRAAR